MLNALRDVTLRNRKRFLIRESVAAGMFLLRSRGKTGSYCSLGTVDGLKKVTSQHEIYGWTTYMPGPDPVRTMGARYLIWRAMNTEY